jgi:glycosyltransferase involved in cell wall biosynthesis
MAVMLKRIFYVRFLFDMRGFWADERVQGGMLSPNSSLYRLAKALEKLILKQADAVVSLTYAALDDIRRVPYFGGRCPPIAVIPTCVDLHRFRIRNGARVAMPELDSEGNFVLIYSGSLGTWYRLDRLLEFFSALKRQMDRAAFLILTQTELPGLERLLVQYGISRNNVKVRHVPFGQIPEWLSLGDAGIILSDPCLANKARCPTKLAEFLACGLPVVVSAGIGDTEAMVRGERVGVVARELTEKGFEESVTALRELLKDGDLKGRCRRAAEKYFSLDAGSLEYEAVYQRLLGGGEAEVPV